MNYDDNRWSFITIAFIIVFTFSVVNTETVNTEKKPMHTNFRHTNSGQIVKKVHRSTMANLHLVNVSNNSKV